MINSHCIQRMALSAALLVLPLIIYCSEIVGNPYPAVGSAEQAKAVASPVSSAADRNQGDEAPARRILVDAKNKTLPDS
jgi:hypothetical protein